MKTSISGIRLIVFASLPISFIVAIAMLLWLNDAKPASNMFLAIFASVFSFSGYALKAIKNENENCRIKIIPLMLESITTTVICMIVIIGYVYMGGLLDKILPPKTIFQVIYLTIFLLGTPVVFLFVPLFVNIDAFNSELSEGVNLSSTGARPPETGVKNLGSTSPHVIMTKKEADLLEAELLHNPCDWEAARQLSLFYSLPLPDACDYSKALSLVKPFLATKEHDLGVLNEIAGICISCGAYENAENICRQILKKDNNNLASVVNLFQLYGTPGSTMTYDECHAFLDKMKTTYPDKWEPFYYCSMLEMRSEDKDITTIKNNLKKAEMNAPPDNVLTHIRKTYKALRRERQA